MSEENTPELASEGGLSSTELFAELDSQVEVWEAKARVLDRKKDRLPKVADYVDEHKRLSTKAGVYRAVARDLSLLLRDFLPANVQVHAAGAFDDNLKIDAAARSRAMPCSAYSSSLCDVTPS